VGINARIVKEGSDGGQMLSDDMAECTIGKGENGKRLGTVKKSISCTFSLRGEKQNDKKHSPPVTMVWPKLSEDSSEMT
jgi:hypothetical protein